jgi:ribonuclease P protein component
MPRNARQEGYSRRHRFSAPGAYGPVLRGNRKVRGPLAVIHAAPARGTSSRFGVALTRRLVASSVDRNAVRRLARETFRRHAVKLAGLDCVVMLRGRYEPRQARALAEEIRGLLDQLVAQK